jgi:predicted metalloprotease with PDZ domain
VSTPVQYHVDLSQRRQHLVAVTLTVPAELVGGARLVLPTWTPGSYFMRDYVHHVQQITATDANDEAVPLSPDGHTAWRLPETVAGPVTVRYELYANDLTVRTNHVDDHHALLVAPATFVLVEAARDHEHRVEIATDHGRTWALLPSGEAPDTYVAADADHLVDSAFEVGDFPHVTVDVAGVPHTFVWSGHGGHPDLTRIGDDVAAIGATARDLFDGDLPVSAYTFLCVGWDAGGGGLEHRDGTVLMMPVTTFQEPDLYARFQSLMAHEYLHLWNVKRLVPAELVRPDLERHTHTTSLWVAEGWTAYYDELLPLRARCWARDRFLKTLGEQLDTVLERPGARLQSVTESSYHAWTKLYVRDENWVNAGTDYYAHGALLAWCLDLLIRRHAPDSDGLDTALRSLWRDFGTTGRGYSPADVVAAVSAAAGTDLQAFFDAHVTGLALPDVDDLVGVVGLEIQRPVPDDAAPHLGVQTSDTDDGVTIDAVLRDGPAWQGGVTGGDRLLAIDGLRVGRGKLAAVLRSHAPGDEVECAVFRGPRLLTLPVRLGAPFRPRQLRAVGSPTDAQQDAFRRWTGLDLIEGQSSAASSDSPS